MLTVREIMTENVTTIGRDCSVQDAIELMLARGVSGLPVVDESGNLSGIVTEYALLAIAYDHDVADDTVAEHMTTDVLTIEADQSLSQAADLCIAHRIRRAPVMENGQLVGLISRRDVLKSLYESAAIAR